ncbi:hypothetical protein [Lysobacter gummosus]
MRGWARGVNPASIPGGGWAYGARRALTPLPQGGRGAWCAAARAQP